MPFGKYSNFQDCVNQNRDKSNPEAYCAALHHKITGKWPAEKSFNPDLLISIFKIAFKIGGPGSGNFGHAGRPGMVGGSAPRGKRDKISEAMYGKKIPSDVINVYNDTDYTFGQVMKNIFGRGMHPSTLCHEVGVPQDASVELIIHRSDYIEIRARGGDYVNVMKVSISADRGTKKPDIYCDLIVKNPSAPKGIGTRFALKLVNMAEKYKGSIEANAAGSFSNNAYNGYYTWAALGADASLPHFSCIRLRDSAPELYDKLYASDKLTVQSIFQATDIGGVSGSEWWRKHGEGFDFKATNEMLAWGKQYLEEKAKKHDIVVGKAFNTLMFNTFGLGGIVVAKKKEKGITMVENGSINIAADDLAYATEEEIKELEDFLRKHNTTGKGIQKVD